MGDPDLGNHAGLAGRMTLRRTLPVVEEADRIGAGMKGIGDVDGLVILGVRKAVRLTLADLRAVDGHLVLLVAGDVGAGPDDG